MRALGRALLVLVLAMSAGCGGALGKQYEYEEDVYLALDGSATIMVNTSIPALVALRGFTLDTSARAVVDREAIRGIYASPVSSVTRVSRPWRRDGRRFVQVRLSVPDIRKLPGAAPFAWSTYGLAPQGEALRFEQVLGASANRFQGDVRWTGNEIVAFRLHLPARIQEHNTPSRKVERGNILSWEQPLRARLAGVPLRIAVRMDNHSILYRTLWVFGSAFAAAMALLAMLIWWVSRERGRTGTDGAGGTRPPDALADVPAPD